jgi:hypothetical protein
LATKTLAELKRENEEAESKAEVEETAVIEEEIVEDEEVIESDVESDEDAEESEGVEPEAWMTEENSEEQGSETSGEKLFTGSDIAAAKRKLNAKLEQRDSELEQLKKEVESLKQGGNKAQSAPANKPRREDFYSADDPDEAFAEALVEWKLNTQAAQANQQNNQREAVARIEKEVDRHYESAERLVQEHGISPEVYQQADRAFRASIDQVMPGAGDSIADALIANLGEGSEKATFYLGRNKGKLAEFQNALLTDKSGIRAAMILGEIKQSVLMPKKQISRTPAPPKQIQGDAAGGLSGQAKKYSQQYTSAHKRGDHQAAYNAKKAARAAGIDTTSW